MRSAPPRLLNGLLNICMEQRFVTATINVIEFSQLLTQALVAPHQPAAAAGLSSPFFGCLVKAMWFHSNPLLQLPHFDMAQVKT